MATRYACRHGWQGPAVAAALVVPALLSLRSWGPSVVPVVPYPHESPLGTSALMVVALPLLSLWGISVSHRCADAVVRRRLLLIDILLVTWNIDALVKYTAVSDAVVELCWYLYYIPIVYLPLLLVLAALRVSGLEGCPWAIIVRRGAVLVGAALFSAVATNGLHGLAFVFDRLDPAWDVNYAYGPVYAAVHVWTAVMLLAFLALIVIHARKALRRVVLLVALVFVLGIAYSLLYALRVPLAYLTNYCLLYTSISVIVVEASLDLGLLPSYRGVARLFEDLPLDIKILSPEGATAFASRSATPLTERAWRALAGLELPRGRMTSFRLPLHLVCHAFGIPGGMAVLTEDIAELDDLRRALDLRREDLERHNRAIERARGVREELLARRIERDLVADVEPLLSESVDLMHDILSSLPDAGDETSRERRRRRLVLVKLLVAYCKRRGALALAGDGVDPLGAEHLHLLLDEIVADVRSAGMVCAMSVDVSGNLSNACMGQLYDCIHDLLMLVSKDEGATLIVHLGEGRAGHIELRAAVDVGDEEACEALGRQLRGDPAHGLAASAVDVDDTVLHVHMTVSRGTVMSQGEVGEAC